MRSLLNFFKHADWKRQHRWRHAIWRSMGALGLTGLHVLPLHGRWVQICRVPMRLAGLGEALEGFRIAQISDLHYSPVVRRRYLRQMIELVGQLEVDLVIVSGDLLTGGRLYVRGVTKLLENIVAAHPTIVTLGNHDYTMLGKRRPAHGRRVADKLTKSLESAGMVVLRNQRLTLERKGQKLTIVGLDDEWTGALDAERAFDGIDESHPIVCVNHNPVNARELMDYPWQWMLSGHTHGRALKEIKRKGKVLRRGRPFVAGQYEVSAGRYVYVNRGLSYGDRRRAANRPEITVFSLVSG
jgi:uncharacterized protein